MSRLWKELASLAPWGWDPHVQSHPPGSAALKDFTRVDRWPDAENSPANKAALAKQTHPVPTQPRAKRAAAIAATERGFTQGHSPSKGTTSPTCVKRQACELNGGAQMPTPQICKRPRTASTPAHPSMQAGYSSGEDSPGRDHGRSWWSESPQAEPKGLFSTPGIATPGAAPSPAQLEASGKEGGAKLQSELSSHAKACDSLLMPATPFDDTRLSDTSPDASSARITRNELTAVASADADMPGASKGLGRLDQQALKAAHTVAVLHRVLSPREGTSYETPMRNVKAATFENVSPIPMLPTPMQLEVAPVSVPASSGNAVLPSPLSRNSSTSPPGAIPIDPWSSASKSRIDGAQGAAGHKLMDTPVIAMLPLPRAHTPSSSGSRGAALEPKRTRGQYTGAPLSFLGACSLLTELGKHGSAMEAYSVHRSRLKVSTDPAQAWPNQHRRKSMKSVEVAGGSVDRGLSQLRKQDAQEGWSWQPNPPAEI
ncbi:hypothetical protein CYMTET_51116 [Cymbomonas tetramitiformis]|uniref:Uncharacterized protein n=1 Tax=Cymbomonas tetramitiformis TaxID=36881 RepID=A0AAE0ES55_9CHLO|nr:hypothetical protein CYMTET_51116 [Cymbomonas tetramitiformis]